MYDERRRRPPAAARDRPDPQRTDRRRTPPPAARVVALQRAAGNAAVATALASGGGRPLPRAVRAPMEAAFGTTFDEVRIHEDDRPRALGAIAYARGDDLHFAPGAFRPDTDGGRHVIAHELAHVVQQRRAGRTAVQPLGAPTHAADAALERAADAAAARAVRGEQADLTGPAAPARGIVQCYQYVDPNVWTVGAGERSPRFPSQRLKTTDYTAEHKTTRGIHKQPRLKVSNAGDLAIEATAGFEAKTFYALPAKVQESNAKLADVGSQVHLDVLDRTLDVPADPTAAFSPGDPMRRLSMIRPVYRDDPKAIAETTLGQHECIEVMKVITGIAGSGSVAVLEAGGHRAEQPVDHDHGPVEMAAEVVQGRSPQHVAGDVAGMGTPDRGVTSRNYGRLSAGEHDARSAGLGVNEHASPEVGEAFGTFSVSPPTGGVFALDYTQERANPALRGALDTVEGLGPLPGTQDALAQQLTVLSGLLRNEVDDYVKARIWNAHYAAVVAKSGPDMVTLENYNRDTVLKWQFIRIRENLERQVPAFRHAMAGRDYRRGIAVLQEIGAAVAEAQSAYASLQALMQANAGKQKMWYFAMFGPAQENLRGGGNENQSWHAAMEATGDFANPISLRLRRETTPDGWERHAQGVDVEQTKDDYNSLNAAPVGANGLDVERTTLISTLAYANAHQSSHGRKSRIASMRTAVNAVIGRNGPNLDLARYVLTALTTARQSRWVK